MTLDWWIFQYTILIYFNISTFTTMGVETLPRAIKKWKLP